jgi:hypothetical protein
MSAQPEPAPVERGKASKNDKHHNPTDDEGTTVSRPKKKMNKALPNSQGAPVKRNPSRRTRTNGF